MAVKTFQATTEHISMEEAGRILGVHRVTVRNYIMAGKLRGYRLGNRHIRVNAGEVYALLKPIATAVDH